MGMQLKAVFDWWLRRGRNEAGPDTDATVGSDGARDGEPLGSAFAVDPVVGAADCRLREGIENQIAEIEALLSNHSASLCSLEDLAPGFIGRDLPTTTQHRK